MKDARSKLKKVKKKTAPQYDHPAELVGDKGYHSRETLKKLDSAFRSRISEPKANGLHRWNGDHEARRAVYANRARIRTSTGKAMLRKRGVIEKRYSIHAAGFNLGLLMRSIFGVETPKGWAEAHIGIIFVIFSPSTVALIVLFFSERTKFGRI